MKTQFYGAASLDGFIASTDHSLDWLLQFGEVESSSYLPFIAEVGAIAMGSSTYLWILQYLVKFESGSPQPWPYVQPAWVFSSRQLPTVPGADIRFVQGAVLPVHQEMAVAAAGKNIWIMGGGELVGQFYDLGLLDELIVQVTSVVLGAGLPLLPRRIINPPLRLLSATIFGESYAELRYAVPKGR